jgi:hypothetical protein
MSYLSLDPARIIATAEALERRIRERFPDSGLGRVAGELVSVTREAAARAEKIRKPNFVLWSGVGALILAFFVVVILILTRLRVEEERLTYSVLIQSIDALLESTVFLGASALFLLTLDTRLKRRRVLRALHELRSLAHIVDMHQLTKDPEFVTEGGEPTPSSPQRIRSRFELARYLDYASEVLSLSSKVAALYVQGFEDPVALSAVDEVEDLTNGLSRKIWQKIMILDHIAR